MSSAQPFDDDLRDADPPAETGNLVERLHARLHDMLLTHEIPIGRPISERQLSTQLAVSRTPLREALRRLEGEGFIQRHNSVLEVRRITLEEFVDLLKIRRLLEVEAAGNAAGAMDPDLLVQLRERLQALLDASEPDNHERVSVDLALHRAILDACGNRSMGELIEQLRRKSMLFATPPLPSDFRQVVAMHIDLLDALAAGDAPRARTVMATHLDQVLDKILSRLLRR